MGMTKYAKQYVCNHNKSRDGNRYPTDTIWRCCFQCVAEIITDVTPLSVVVERMQAKFDWSESTARRAIERLVDSGRLAATPKGKKWFISLPQK